MPRYATLEERFWSKVNKTESCWLWSGYLNDKGYGIIATKTQRAASTHRLAFEFAYGPIPDGLWVLHTCDNPACCRNDDAGWYELDGVLLPRRGHLFLGTQRENMRDMAVKGRHAQITHPESYWHGPTYVNATLTEDTIREIRRLSAEGLSQHRLSERFGISRSMVSMIQSGKRWKGVTQGVDMSFNRAVNQPRGVTSPNTKLVDDDVRAIRALRQDGLSERMIAARFGIGRSTVRHILDGDTWQHVI